MEKAKFSPVEAQTATTFHFFDSKTRKRIRNKKKIWKKRIQERFFPISSNFDTILFNRKLFPVPADPVMKTLCPESTSFST